MKIVGLTGGIGSGKSTVADLFSKLEIPIIDADVIARDLVTPHSPALSEIEQAFGSEYIKHGELDRTALRQLIFTDPKAKTTLERILHPRIKDKIQEKIQLLKAPYCIVVIPLLIENLNQYDWLDNIIVVDTDENSQIQRTKLRDSADESLIQKIIQQQASRHARLSHADLVIDNSKDLSYLEGQVDDCHHWILKHITQ